MTYTINKSDGTTLTTIAESTLNTSACSLVLVGRRSVGYGEHIAENFVRLLENSANTTAPSNPITGQFWFDKTAEAIKIYGSLSSWNTIATFNANGTTINGNQLVSTCTAPMPPIIVASNTKVVNLNADYLDGYDTAIAATPSTIPVRNSNGDIFAVQFQGVATSAKYADLAERFEASEALEVGDFVAVGGDKEIRKAKPDEVVLGVISENPGFRMNEDAGPDSTHPFVAYIGRVPVKVRGPVAKGGRLVLSPTEDGVAVGASMIPGPLYPTLGVALEDKSDDGLGLVMTVYGVK